MSQIVLDGEAFRILLDSLYSAAQKAEQGRIIELITEACERNSQDTAHGLAKRRMAREIIAAIKGIEIPLPNEVAPTAP